MLCSLGICWVKNNRNLLAVVFGLHVLRATKEPSSACVLPVLLTAAAGQRRQTIKFFNSAGWIWSRKRKTVWKIPPAISYHGSMEKASFFFLFSEILFSQSHIWLIHIQIIGAKCPFFPGCNPMVDAHNGKTPPFRMNLHRLAGLCHQTIGVFRRKKYGFGRWVEWGWLLGLDWSINLSFFP